MKLFFPNTCFLLICLLSAHSVNASPPSTISLMNISGENEILSKYIGHGQWVVLNIWGTDCPPCREEMPELVRFHDEHKDTDGVVVGIAIDFPSYGYANKDEVITFAEDYLIDFPLLLSDSDITVKMGLGRLEGLPTTYIFDPDGNIKGMQVGAVTQDILEKFINKLKLHPRSSTKQ